MLKHRLIAVIIVRNGEVVQSVQFKHTNTIHSSSAFAVETFSRWSIDELCIINVDRNRDGLEKFAECIDMASRECFVPISAGGWVDSEEYAENLIRRGADKLILNSAFYTDPDLVKKLSSRFGRQCIVGSMDCKLINEEQYGIAVDRGRFDINIPPTEWAKHMENLGAGEILFNSISFDGARKGYDLKNLREVSTVTSLPIIAFGGVFKWKHLVEGLECGADAVAAANIFHYTEQSTKRAKKFMFEAGFPTRIQGLWKGGEQTKARSNRALDEN